MAPVLLKVMIPMEETGNFRKAFERIAPDALLDAGVTDFGIFLSGQAAYVLLDAPGDDPVKTLRGNKATSRWLDGWTRHAPVNLDDWQSYTLSRLNDPGDRETGLQVPPPGDELGDSVPHLLILHLDHTAPQVEADLLGDFPWDALPAGRVVPFHRGHELVIYFEGPFERSWDALFDGEAGSSLETQLRRFTNFDLDQPAAYLTVDTRFATKGPAHVQRFAE